MSLNNLSTFINQAIAMGYSFDVAFVAGPKGGIAVKTITVTHRDGNDDRHKPFNTGAMREILRDLVGTCADDGIFGDGNITEGFGKAFWSRL